MIYSEKNEGELFLFITEEGITMSVRVRFAPSPTGHLHIGSARTALFNYLFAKHHQGTYILRIEDTDVDRNIEGAEEKLIQELQWLGLFWDEGPDVGGEYGPYRSMERMDLYTEYLSKMLDEEKAYRCFCTKDELEAEREAMMARGEVPRYSEKCRHQSKEEGDKLEAQGRPFTVRFKVPKGATLDFQDHIRGHVSFQSDDVEDFVIFKSNGIPTYHFAVCVDDTLMKITHVIRGEEHLSNTPKHLLLFDAFAATAPEFAHIPLILNETGKKLSKRDESVLQFMAQYRNLGYLPEAVNNYLALLGWSPSGEFAEEEIFSMEQLVKLFSLDRINRSGAIFDPGKLAWVNGQYIKKAQVDDLLKMATPYFENHDTLPEERVREFVTLFQSGMNSMSEIVPLVEPFLLEAYTLSEEGKEVLVEESVRTVLTAFKQKIAQLEDYTASNIKPLLKEVQQETGFKGKQLFMPIRVAVTGEIHGPDLNQTIYLLGKDKVIKRIEDVLKWINEVQ